MLNELAKEIHENAVAHGWWDQPYTFGEIISLCHSELSEALEEYRASRGNVWFKCNLTQQPCRSKMDECKDRDNKPEGIAVELCDCVLRILDWAGKENIDMDYPMIVFEEFPTDIPDKFGDFISECNLCLSTAYKYKDSICYAAVNLAEVIDMIFTWAKREGLDIFSILRLKMDYNKGRSYRHGNKVL